MEHNKPSYYVEFHFQSKLNQRFILKVGIPFMEMERLGLTMNMPFNKKIDDYKQTFKAFLVPETEKNMR